VALINGVDACEYIEKFSRQAAPLQDPDAAYNLMFFEKAFAVENVGRGLGSFTGGGRFRYIYPGANTTFEFGNGTTVVYRNIAFAKGDFAGVTDGELFYQKFCAVPSAVPQPSPTASSTSATGTAAHTTSSNNELRTVNIAPGYPKPVATSSDNAVSGYFLDDEAYGDVAVLAVLNFQPVSSAEFQAVVQGFISEAKSSGKTKIVIDLSANGGGYILQGYVNGLDAFLNTLLIEYKDAQKRFEEISQRVTKLVTPPVRRYLLVF
jgi:Peptidase family S41